jgi:hypothetical protein
MAEPTIDGSRRPLSRGYLLNGYRIERTLGGGGFSLVYLAYHVATRIKVVIKEYFPEALVARLPGGRLDPTTEGDMGTYHLGIKRFFSEASALAKLKHPNIVNVSNIFRTNNTVYMVMDYAQGQDLRWYIKHPKSRIGEQFMLIVFSQTALGLRELHDNSFLHLDIKPANILLRPRARPLLIDFGAVQRVEPGTSFGGVQTLTHGFAAPEQYQQGPMGPWADLYALGATMYSCIARRPPPPALERQKNDILKPVSKTHARKYPKSLLSSIEWAIQLDHRERPKSVNAFLEHALADYSKDLAASALKGTLTVEQVRSL